MSIGASKCACVWPSAWCAVARPAGLSLPALPGRHTDSTVRRWSRPPPPTSRPREAALRRGGARTRRPRRPMQRRGQSLRACNPAGSTAFAFDVFDSPGRDHETNELYTKSHSPPNPDRAAASSAPEDCGRCRFLSFHRRHLQRDVPPRAGHAAQTAR